LFAGRTRSAALTRVPDVDVPPSIGGGRAVVPFACLWPEDKRPIL
jgi:hypothetical protein